MIDELLPEIDAPMPSDISPRRIPSELVDALARTEGSPFQGLIRRPSDPEGKKGVIVDTGLIKVAQSSLKNYGALALHKGIGRQGADLHGMYDTMSDYWTAVRNVFDEAWGLPATQSRLALGHPGHGCFDDRIVPEFKRRELQNNIQKAQEAIRPNCAWTEGEWEGLGMA